MGKLVNINPSILRKCREQMALDIDTVRRKVRTIEQIENGEKKPTFKQLANLASMYTVPDWVFVRDTLPEKYRFSSLASFRKFKSSHANKLHDLTKIYKLTAKVEGFREMILDLKEDMQEPIPVFSPPQYKKKPDDMAQTVRSWLGVRNNQNFSEWRKTLEKVHIFIFMTSKYNSWSKIDIEVLRGLCIFYERLPIIVINDSDTRKAQSFTLFHELGHLLQRKSSIDQQEHIDNEEEKWCDLFAGNMLMPETDFRAKAGETKFKDLAQVKKLANVFCVSPYACIVRLRQCKMINQAKYLEFESTLKKEYEQNKEKLEKNPGGPTRIRSKEAFNQFGGIYSRAVWQSYYNEQIGLHKLCKLFELKHASHALEMQNLL